MEPDLPPGAIGAPHVRIDGPAKVTGEAVYPADEMVTNPAFACLVTSPIARGRVTGIQTEQAMAMPGVLDILTHFNVGDQAKTPAGPGGTTTLESDRIWHDGQIVAVVVADTFEIAREAANRVKVECEAEAPAASFDSQGVSEEPAKGMEGGAPPGIGDAFGAFNAAPVKVDARYETPTQHHNAMELFSTTCQWRGDELTIYEPSQFVGGLQAGVASQLGIPRQKVRAVSKFIGGAFGGKGAATARTVWIAIAARRLKRPVKLVPTRDQGFTIATYRAETRHRLRLAANRDGRLTALIHEAESVTSRPSPYNANGLSTTGRLYAAANVHTEAKIIHADRNTPGFMRAPPETPFLFPLECAMDELAAELGSIDPIELRRDQRHQQGSDQRPAVHQPFVDALLRRSRRRLRLVAAQLHARRNAGRRLADRLGLRLGRLFGEHRRRRLPADPVAARQGAAPDRRPRAWHRHADHTRHRRRRRPGPEGRRRGGGHRRQHFAAGRAGRRFEPRLDDLQCRGQGLRGRALAAGPGGGAGQQRPDRRRRSRKDCPERWLASRRRRPRRAARFGGSTPGGRRRDLHREFAAWRSVALDEAGRAFTTAAWRCHVARIR